MVFSVNGSLTRSSLGPRTPKEECLPAQWLDSKPSWGREEGHRQPPLGPTSGLPEGGPRTYTAATSGTATSGRSVCRVCMSLRSG